MNRQIRRNIDIMLTGLGIALIFTAVLLGSTLTITVQMPMALFGVLLMEAGVWGLSNKFFPSDRRFSRLRVEGNRMLDMVRELNSAAISKDIGQEDAKRFQATLEEMHNSVVKMAELAGIEDGAKIPIKDNRVESDSDDSQES
ncbi:MAG: hypothetical protein GKR91_17790 [Pseudomonadales bacterium]|nr:hypothetical protein [Pseudomonadales bacterium]